MNWYRFQCPVRISQFCAYESAAKTYFSESSDLFMDVRAIVPLKLHSFTGRGFLGCRLSKFHGEISFTSFVCLLEKTQLTFEKVKMKKCAGECNFRSNPADGKVNLK